MKFIVKIKNENDCEDDLKLLFTNVNNKVNTLNTIEKCIKRLESNLNKNDYPLKDNTYNELLCNKLINQKLKFINLNEINTYEFNY